MKTEKAFALNPLSASIKWLTLMPLLLASTQTMAGIVDNGQTERIDGNTASDTYLVRNASNLISNGASTQDITAQTGSTLSLTGTTVTTTALTGVFLQDSSATISGGSITAGRTGLSLQSSAPVNQGSKATVTDVTITGGTTGATVGSTSELDLVRTTLVGTSGFGLQMANGRVSATGGTIQGGINGIVMTTDPNVPQNNRLTLSGTKVEGQSGSAISVTNFSAAPITADIRVENGSTLTGGNGKILEVGGTSIANMVVDNSALVGDVSAEAGATANLTLQNQATLTGQLDNVNSLIINSDARWVMVGDGSVANLALNGGGVQFGNPGEFFKLTVGELSGTGGTFYMHTNFGVVDTLTVTGNATGNHQVLIDASGSEPVAAASLPVIHTGGGDATFSLVGGPVDLGAFSYDLIQQGSNDWFLDTASKVVSPSTQTVLALADALPTVFYGELTTMRSRMGELRLDEGKAGGWVRAYGNKFNVSTGVADYQQNQQGLSFGADAPLPFGDGQWLVGLLAGYSKSDLNLDRGSSGTVDSYYIGGYATWLDKQTGYYLDSVLKFNRYQNEADVHLSDGTRTKGDYDTEGVGASVEFGRHIKLADGFYVEPYAQAAALVVKGQSYDLDNGLQADSDRTRSLLGKVGATVGRNYDLGEGKVVQPYVRAAYVHEFANNNDVDVNNNTFTNDLSGSRGELGFGVAMNVSERISLHADADYSNGEKIEQPWGLNFGARYSW
ncbi:autotransporter outer membrane beta-barrel domain-containing protein [Pseudomonas sp. SDO55104_S430]